MFNIKKYGATIIWVYYLPFVFIANIVLLAKPLVAADPESLDRRARVFVETLAGRDFQTAAGRFDATMAKAMPPEKLREAWEALLGQVGPFKGQKATRQQKILQYDVIFVTCEFEKATIDIKVVYNKDGKVSGLFFEPSAYTLPSYAKVGAYKDTGAHVGSGVWTLPATLTLPQEAGGPFPAVVLVHGSGPQDRDETIGPNKPFRDLAVGLASRGIAVLRFEKRTKEHAAQFTPVLMKSLTVKEETIDDALNAVAILRQSPDIDPNRIFVLGHSLGGMLAARIAAGDAGIAGFIVMAGAARPLEDAILEQSRYIADLDGVIDEKEKNQLEVLEQQVALVKSDQLSSSTLAMALPLGVPAKYWLDLRGYDPAKAAASITAPMLILQGGRDYQVTMDDFNRWEDGLSSRADVEFRLYPSLNHLFIAGEGRAEPADYQRPGHVESAVIEDIAGWIQKLK